MPKKRMLNPREDHILSTYVYAHMVTTPDPQYHRWDEESESDLHVAEILDPQIDGINEDHVMRRRMALGFTIKPRRLTPVSNDVDHDALDELRAEVEDLQVRLVKAITDFEGRLTALEDKFTSPKDEMPTPQVPTSVPLTRGLLSEVMNETSSKALRVAAPGVSVRNKRT